MDISKISVGFNPPYDVNAIIEIPQGGEPVKYELDKESGAIYVDRFLHTAMFYPGNYGFIPHTLLGDFDDGVDVIGRVDAHRDLGNVHGEMAFSHTRGSSRGLWTIRTPRPTPYE